MNDIELLIDLIRAEYGIDPTAIKPIHQFVVEGRGIFQVEQNDSSPWLLRAFRQSELEVLFWLTARASVLDFLARQGFPAPRLVPTQKDQIIGVYDGWAGLMLTYIEGEMAEVRPDHLRAMGAVLGQLHQLDLTDAPFHLPLARWRPAQPAQPYLNRLRALSSNIPHPLLSLYESCLAALQRVDRWGQLPTCLIHTDCWQWNAIRQPDGDTTLIDWDGAGFGIAVLDLAYLLTACHINLQGIDPPDPIQIEAVLAGYLSQRTLSTEEVAALPDAIEFSRTFWAADVFTAVLPGDWRNDTRLNKFIIRCETTPQIAQVANQILAAR